VHLVGFIIGIYHDAQSSECQKCVKISLNYLEQAEVSFIISFNTVLYCNKFYVFS